MIHFISTWRKKRRAFKTFKIKIANQNFAYSQHPQHGLLTLTLLGVLRETCWAAILPLLQLVGRQQSTHHFLHQLVTVAVHSTTNCPAITADWVTDVIEWRRLSTISNTKKIFYHYFFSSAGLADIMAGQKLSAWHKSYPLHVETCNPSLVSEIWTLPPDNTSQMSPLESLPSNNSPEHFHPV